MSNACTLFAFGLGYCARALAREVLAVGWEVRGTTREAAMATAHRREGIEAFRFADGVPLAGTALVGVTHLLSSVPPDGDGDPVLRRHGSDIAALAAAGRLAWAGYLSTTGVYGDRGGGWVDEDSDLRPSTERGRRRQAAEAAWQALYRDHGVPVHVFRLAGIYGPGRSPLDAVREGRARRVVKPGQVFSRIHVADVARVLRASMARPNPGAAYNVCDDTPAPPQEVIEFACRLAGVPPPPEVPIEAADLGPMAESFYAENKRVSNRRIKEELGVVMAYPDYRSGLEALAGRA